MIERIYVAAPYSAPSNFEIRDNVEEAISAANEVIKKGHFVFCPHLSYFLDTDKTTAKKNAQWWYNEDNTFLDHWATAFLYLASSYGADLELDRAKKLGLKIYHSLDEIPGA